MTDATIIRIAHFSDIHISGQQLGFRWRDLPTKRTTGWLNLRLRRGGTFRDAAQIAASMMRDIRARGCQHAVFSGDATSMGFAREFQVGARALGLEATNGLPGLAVPGNHDYYTRSAVRSGEFEKTFAQWQQGERIDDHVYPFAQRVGHCWLIGVNSARSNFLVWDSRGQVGREQADRLRELFKRLGPGPRILVTHYPLYLADGTPEKRWRRMRDWRSFQNLLIENHVALSLHGHRHVGYILEPQVPDQPFPIICAGSATQFGKWAWNEYTIQDLKLSMIRRTWDPSTERFVESEQHNLQLFSLRGSAS